MKHQEESAIKNELKRRIQQRKKETCSLKNIKIGLDIGSTSGRIYQQTVVDTYSFVIFAKVYTGKIPVTAADTLNDRVLPFFEEHEVPVSNFNYRQGTVRENKRNLIGIRSEFVRCRKRG